MNIPQPLRQEVSTFFSYVPLLIGGSLFWRIRRASNGRPSPTADTRSPSTTTTPAFECKRMKLPSTQDRSRAEEDLYRASENQSQAKGNW